MGYTSVDRWGVARAALAAVGVVIATTSCVFINPIKQDPTFGKASALTVKPVNGKREPNYLISIDGTECTVSKKRFDKVKVGDNQLCLWSAPR